MTEKNPWKTTSSRLIYENPWITLREDQVINPRGLPGIYSVVSSRAATGAVAVNDKNEVYLVGQYRYATDVYSWEIPEGGANLEETPLEAIKRELREEAGLIASSWEILGGEIHTSNCFCSEKGYLFLARDLKEVEHEPDETEVLQVKKIPFSEALSMVENGMIYDAMSIIGLYRAKRALGI